MAAGRSAILSGDRADGTQQRLRYGLGEHRPYRWHGIPGWNPAKVLEGRYPGEPRDRACPKCGARPGEPCQRESGGPMRGCHVAR